MTDDEFFDDLYRRRYEPDVRYAATKMGRLGPNKFWLTLEAAEIFDEVMAKYHRDGEHRDRDANHEQRIRHRIRLKLVDIIRREKAKKRTLPGVAVVDLRHQSRTDGDDDGSANDPVDQDFAKAIFDIETEDAVSRLDEVHQRVVRLRLDGKTHEQIGEELGVSPETARQRLHETRSQLNDDP